MSKLISANSLLQKMKISPEHVFKKVRDMSRMPRQEIVVGKEKYKVGHYKKGETVKDFVKDFRQLQWGMCKKEARKKYFLRP
jgi:hypothetical protein